MLICKIIINNNNHIIRVKINKVQIHINNTAITAPTNKIFQVFINLIQMPNKLMQMIYNNKYNKEIKQNNKINKDSK